MNRQCRICLDDAHPEMMIAPCRCRGSAEFIHKLCLEEYVRHFPDGVCRVCRQPMIRINEIETFVQIILYFWFSLIICFATIPLHTKLLYMTMLTGLFVYTTTRNVLGQWAIFTIFMFSYMFLMMDEEYLVKTIIGLGAFVMVCTTCYYVPPQYVLLIGTIGLSSMYATILTVYVATTTDSYMTSYFVGLLSVMWLAFIHARPPFHAIN